MIIDTINTYTQNKPLVYFTREVERALGVENKIKNYHICCIEDNAIIDQLIQAGVSVFCLERSIQEVSSKSTPALIAHPKTKEWLDTITKGEGFYGISFYPASSTQFKIEEIGGTFLGNNFTFFHELENKIRIKTLFEQLGVQSPTSIVEDLGTSSFSDLKNQIGSSDSIVIQIAKSHTGLGTFFVSTDQEYMSLTDKLGKQQVKISKTIHGQTYTVNCCNYNGKTYIGSLQKQITGIKQLVPLSGSTVGTQFTSKAEFTDELIQKLRIEINKISKHLVANQFRGLFGIDFIVANNEVFFIEINARQTANLPFQTHLEIMNGSVETQFELHIASFLNIQDQPQYEELKDMVGAQVFLRARADEVKIDSELTTGLYRLQSDNSAYNWDTDGPDLKDNVIFLDEERDKPLIFQQEAYKFTENQQNGFIIIFQRKGSVKNAYDEICRIQFLDEVIVDNSIKPWIIEALVQIRRRVSI